MLHQFLALGRRDVSVHQVAGQHEEEGEVIDLVDVIGVASTFALSLFYVNTLDSQSQKL